MRGNLIQYVHLFFAGTSGCEEMRDEILQNTLDRYDDLVSQGKSPEAAYQLCISGIGDLKEFPGNEAVSSQKHDTVPPDPNRRLRENINRLIWCLGVALYLGLSFLTRAWEITWIIFPLMGAVQGLTGVIIDRKNR